MNKASDRSPFRKMAAAVLFLLVFSPLSFAESLEQGEKPASAGKYPAFGFSKERTVVEQGAKVYNTYCVGCHGVQGDGKGPASSFLDPKPRNFQTAEFRFSSRPSGELPTDEDLFHTVTEGLTGTSMPSWKLLPETDRKAVIVYLKTFASDTWKNAVSSAPTAIVEDPFYGQDKEQAIRRGEKVYHGMAQCYSCHAAFLGPAKINEARAEYKMPPLKGFRKDLGTAKVIPANDGSLMIPPDFTWNRLKRGAELRSLYHVIGNGIGGTAMPTWKGVLPEEDLWSLVYYVQYLASLRPSLVTETDIRQHQERINKIEQERDQYEEQMKREEAERLKKLAEEKLKQQAAEAAKTEQPPIAG